MQDNDIIYANSFSVATNDFGEVVIVLEVTTPLFENGSISSVSTQKVADIRLNMKVAKMLCDTLNEEINIRASKEQE